MAIRRNCRITHRHHKINNGKINHHSQSKSRTLFTFHVIFNSKSLNVRKQYNFCNIQLKWISIRSLCVAEREKKKQALIRTDDSLFGFKCIRFYVHWLEVKCDSTHTQKWNLWSLIMKYFRKTIWFCRLMLWCVPLQVCVCLCGDRHSQEFICFIVC